MIQFYDVMIESEIHISRFWKRTTMFTCLLTEE